MMNSANPYQTDHHTSSLISKLESYIVQHESYPYEQMCQINDTGEYNHYILSDISSSHWFLLILYFLARHYTSKTMQYSKSS